MFALIFLLLSILAGGSVAALFPLQVRRFEFLALAIATGLPLAAWVSFIFSLIFGYAIGLPLSFVGLMLPGFIVWRFGLKRINVSNQPYSKRYRYISWGLVTIIAGLLTWIMIMSYGSWPAANGDYRSNGNVWADGPLHLSLANQFALNGNRVDLVAPYYNKAALSYPFLPDFYSGILHRLGLGWSASFLIPGLLLTDSLCLLVFSVGLRLTGSVRAAWIQLLLLIFSGSTAGAIFNSQQILSHGFGALWDYHLQLGMQSEDMVYNFIQAFLLPQRAFMFGMPMMLLVILLGHWLWNQNQFLMREKKVAIIIGAIIGLMPLVHTHSFYVTVGLLGLSFVTALIFARDKLIRFVWIALPAIILATPQAWWQFSHTYYTGYQKIIHGWKLTQYVTNEHQNWLIYWLKGTGVLGVFMATGWLLFKKFQVNPILRFFFLAGIIIFAAANLYVFQPSIWDNAKFFVYSFWYLSLPLAYILSAVSRKPLGAVLSAVAIWSMTFMGFLTIIHSASNLNYVDVSASEATFASRVSQAVPAEALILTAERHNDPVFVLSGRKVLLDYSGWDNLFDSHWADIATDRDLMVMGAPESEQLMCQRRVSYAAIDALQVASGKVNLGYFQSTFPVLLNEANWWLFDLREACSKSQMAQP